jgi:hypothetical protein
LSEDELERLIEERSRELSKGLEEFKRVFEEQRASVKRAEREKLIKKVLECTGRADH